MAAGDVYEFIIDALCQGQHILNVLHFQDVVGAGDLADLIDHFQGTGAAAGEPVKELTDFLCADYSIDQYLAAKVSPLPRGPQFQFGGDAQAGQRGTAGHLPTSVVTKWTTATGGRSGRGRNYWGPIAQADVTDGVVAGAIQPEITAFTDAMMDVFSAAGAGYDGHWLFGVYSKVLDDFFPILGYAIRTFTKTQRRRQIGVGM